MTVFAKRLVRAIRYFIHGWHSNDYDYGYLLSDMRFKIDRMIPEMKNRESTDVEEIQKQMISTRDALTRLLDDNYLTDLISLSHKQKYGDPINSSIPVKGSDRRFFRFQVGWEKTGFGGPKYHEARKKYSELDDLAVKLRDNDLWTVGSIFSYRKVLKWWD